MKIALPTRDNRIDDHFGHCSFYTIVEIEDNKEISRATMPSPEGCGCKSNIASQLASVGVTLMLAGNMGDGAYNKLSLAGIRVIRGCSGTLDMVLSDYLNGKIVDSGIACEHHSDNHVCALNSGISVDVESIKLK